MNATARQALMLMCLCVMAAMMIIEWIAFHSGMNGDQWMNTHGQLIGIVLLVVACSSFLIRPRTTYQCLGCGRRLNKHEACANCTQPDNDRAE
jgi:hypothetical protein